MLESDETRDTRYYRPVPIIPFPEWLDCIKQLGDDPETNPGFKLIGFLEKDSVRMAGGSVVMGTEATCTDSLTWRRVDRWAGLISRNIIRIGRALTLCIN